MTSAIAFSSYMKSLRAAMVFTVNLDKLILRITLIVLTVVFCVGILRLVYVRFVVNFLTAKERAWFQLKCWQPQSVVFPTPPGYKPALPMFC